MLRFVALVALVSASGMDAAGPPMRKLLGYGDRLAVLAMMDAADAAQRTGVDADAALQWETVVLKMSGGSAYVPFRVRPAGGAVAPKAGAMYVRAISRRGGVARTDEQSALRVWAQQGPSVTGSMPETVVASPGDAPTVGAAAASGKRSIQLSSQSSAALAILMSAREKEQAEGEKARPVFPFEEYYFFNPKSPRGSDPRAVERAMMLPAGEYDVYVAMLDRTRKDARPVVIRRRLDVPDFWNDQLRLSAIMFVSDVHPLKAAFPPEKQAEHPFAFGQAEIVPLTRTSFSSDETLSVVYQICNYGAPDTDMTADYMFYRVADGRRQVFKRTASQVFGDDDLPKPNPWSTSAFAMQAVPLKSFPAGHYELEVNVKDRLTRASAAQTVAFTVGEAR